MKTTHLEDLEFLRGIRGHFGSLRIWSVEYEFTGEEIIERRGGRTKNQVKISDILETKVRPFSRQMTLKTSNSLMKIQIIPSLNEAIMRHVAELNAKKDESERQRFQEVTQQTISRFKRARLIGIIVYILVLLALACVIVWIRRRR